MGPADPAFQCWVLPCVCDVNWHPGRVPLPLQSILCIADKWVSLHEGRPALTRSSDQVSSVHRWAGARPWGWRRRSWRAAALKPGEVGTGVHKQCGSWRYKGQPRHAGCRRHLTAASLGRTPPSRRGQGLRASGSSYSSDVLTRGRPLESMTRWRRGNSKCGVQCCEAHEACAEGDAWSSRACFLRAWRTRLLVLSPCARSWQRAENCPTWGAQELTPLEAQPTPVGLTAPMAGPP